MIDDQREHASGSTTQDGASIGSVVSDLKSAATQKFGEAVTEVQGRANDAKASVAGEVKDVAMVLRRASEDLRGGSAQERTLGTIASRLADASDAIRDKDLGEIVQMVGRVARENPLLFLGGAALVGFAASRYAKASVDQTGASGSSSSRDSRHQFNTFVDEGNPNTQQLQPAS